MRERINVGVGARGMAACVFAEAYETLLRLLRTI